MKTKKLGILLGMVSLVSLLAAPAQAQAQRPHGLPDEYPNKPVTVIVGASAGGGTDIIARLLMIKLGQNWDHSFVVENRVSVMGSVMALDWVSKQPPDGYTLNIVSGSTYLNAALVSKIPKNVMKAMDPIAQFTGTPLLLVVTNSLPVNNLREFLAYAKANPGRLNYGSSGIGGSAHLSTEYMKHERGLFIVHIPYKGIGPAYIDLMAGRVHMAFGTPTSSLPLVRKGSVKLLAITTAKRQDSLPDTPTMAEEIPGFEYVSFFGMVGPAGLPVPVIKALNQGVNEVLAEPDVHKRLSTGGSFVTIGTPEDLQTAMEKLVGNAERLVKEANLDLHGSNR